MDYSKYGISESYLPTVYHNRIIIDKTTAATVNKNLTENAYIRGATGFLGNISSSPIQTLVTVDTNIVFNVPSYSDFVDLSKDDNFADSFEVVTHLFWKNPNFGTSPSPLNIDLPNKYTEQVADIISNINSVEYQKYSLSTVFNNIGKDSLNLTNFDNFTRYQRKFPDGQTYFQVPYTIKFQVPLENIPYMYLLSHASVTDFNIDLNLNFGGFEINDDSITSVSAFEAYNLSNGDGATRAGPLIVDTLISDNNTQTKGVLYTIAQNQSTYQGQIPEGVDLQEVTGSDILREEKFNDLKGTPWLGGVHKHEGRYMAGASHTDKPHPYLDANVVQNKKLIDLRPIKQITEQNPPYFVDALSDVKTISTDYFADNSKNNLLKKLTVISEPFLSTRKAKKEFYGGQEHIDGFFAINYTNFLRKHSIFSSFIVHYPLLQKLFEDAEFDIKIKILRHDVKTKISTLIFDSSGQNFNGTYTAKPSLQSQQFSGNKNNIEVLLGYLSVVNLSKDALNLDVTKGSKIEFYTFTDFDKNKTSATEYKYEVQVEMIDPVFEYLSNGIAAIDKAIRGDEKTLGLKQILQLIKVKKGETNVVSGGKDFPYVVDNTNQQSLNQITNSTIIDSIKEYDLINETVSLTEDNKLVLTQDIAESRIMQLFAYGPGSSNLGLLLFDIVNNILDIENAGNVSIDLIRLAINSLSTIRDVIKDKVNAISNVDILTQSFGYRAATLSAQNGNSGKRIIREKKLSKNKVTKQEYGFDYLANYSDNVGLKQVPVSVLKYFIEFNYLPRYFNKEESNNFPALLNEYLQNYKYSTLTLTKQGVVLPKGLFTPKDYENWPNLLQILLLFIEKNASKLTGKTTFTYTQSDTTNFKFEINKNIEALTDAQFNDLTLLKSLDRGQKQLVTKGLSIQDQITTNQSIFVEFNDEIQTDQNNPDATIPIDNLKKNDISDYFLNYVNNAVENGNENKNRNLNGIINLNVNSLLEDEIKDFTIPQLSLLEYNTGNSKILGNPSPGVGYGMYYRDVWSLQTKKLFLDQFADFFFEYINSVKIEYLSGFDTYNYVGILNESNESTVFEPVDALNNIDISSHRWEQLTNSVLDQLQQGQAVLCKMVDLMPNGFVDMNVPLIQKIKFYKKYYNYFLIIKGQKDLQIREYGSTI